MRPRPLYQEYPYQPPAALFAALSKTTKNIAFLDQQPPYGQYAFLAWNPVQTVPTNVNPFIWLKENNQQTLENIPELPPFQTGWCGYLSYEAAQFIEDIPIHQTTLPLYHTGLFDVVLAFNCASQQCWIIASGLPADNEPQRQQQAQQGIKETINQLNNLPVNSPQKPNPKLAFSAPDQQQFQNAVQRTIDYIYAGDIFQANISHQQHAALPKDYSLPQLFQQLRTQNPAPYGAYYGFDQQAILSCSPEQFLKVQNQQVTTRPIKGTAAPEDAAPLQNSSKNQAENLMIVDLLRNDLSRVCKTGSVTVPKLFDLEHYPNLCHLVSTVTGELQNGLSAIDALSACYPGGSITGAPKVRALEIITELEATARNAYCGSLFYWGHDGSLDSSLLIRTLYTTEDTLYVHAGCGIVADSTPQDEYAESLRKIAKIIELC